eukprot:633051-Rhodomonas_salina.1
MSGTDLRLSDCPMHALRVLSLPSYARATGCPAQPTLSAYARATRCPVLTSRSGGQFNPDSKNLEKTLNHLHP